MNPTAPESWEVIRQWRRERRAVLIQTRIDAGGRRRRQWSEAILAQVEDLLRARAPGILGFYWPFKGEIDARGLVTDLLQHGWQAALPVVVQPGTALEFRLWTPESRMVPGVWKIPVPEVRHLCTPTALLVPLVGFDPHRYRLGYGGGYYDRTLAALKPRPLTIGLGFQLSALDSIHPQNHDIPMDVIVTESTLR